MDSGTFIKAFNDVGFVVLPNLVSSDFLERMRKDLDNALEKEVAYHKGNQEYKDFGMILMCSLYRGSFTALFEQEKFIQPFEWILGEGCIVYAYTSSSMPPHSGNYSQRIHVDCPRVIPNYMTNMGGILAVDDFTEENGATWMLPRSQELLEPPAEEEFYAKAVRMQAKAGSGIYFNARTWHAGGLNQTDHWRRAATINMVRPWMKQRLDIPRAMGENLTEGLGKKTRQKLGFDSQVPASYAEYYVPLEKRKFKQRVE